MSEAVTYRDFLLSVPFGTGFDSSFRGFFPAVKLFLYTPISDWDKAEFRREINRCFFADIVRSSNQKDPHIARGLYGSIRVRSEDAGPNDVESRQYLLLSEHLRKSLKIENVFHSRWERSVGVSRLKKTRMGQRGHSRPSKMPEEYESGARQWLLSPLLFVRDILTDPEFPASEAFAHALVRAHIFAEAIAYERETTESEAQVTPQSRAAIVSPTPDIQEIIRRLISFEAVEASLRKIRLHREIRDNYYPTNATDFIVFHFLAARGFLILAFGAEGKAQSGRKKHKERDIVGRKNFLEKGSLLPRDENGIPLLYEFRVVENVGRLPSTSELMNELDGMPLAIPGADVVFSRGLRTAENRNLIGRISGRSGSGKTSLALALATAMAPLGTQTLYLSCEEDPRDLAERINTLTPEFVSRTFSFNRDTRKWFKAIHFDRDVIENYADIDRFVRDLKVDLQQRVGPGKHLSRVGITPLFVVLDGVHELLLRNVATVQGIDDGIRLRRLIEQFRGLEAVVLILSADTNEAALNELDYVVDFAGTISVDEKENDADRPARRLVLNKTRRQYSRPGGHRIHISGRDGVRISPQVAAQRDAFRNLTWTPVGDDEGIFDVLQQGSSLFSKTKHTVKIFERSLVLISGKGSTGKAGLGLKILCAPLVDQNFRSSPHESKAKAVAKAIGHLTRAVRIDNPAQQMPHDLRRRGVLAVSFLYPKSYYEVPLIKLRSAYEKDGSGAEPPIIDPEVLTFYPGSLSPEVMLRKILNRIERMRLYGTPARGLLVDGIHNVYLQFPEVERHPQLWPVLYELFRLLGLSVVSTHTHFEMPGVEPSEGVAVDIDTVNRRVAPLLNVLVSTVDYHLLVSAAEQKKGAAVPAPFEITVQSAIGQDVRHLTFGWDRIRLVTLR